MAERGGRRDPKGLTKRLLDAAAEVFVERGYDNAVVSDIARRAGATTGAIYSRWPQKKDMMVAALDHLFGQISPEQRMRSLGVEGMSASEILSVWGANLLVSDAVQGVLVQAFASARTNEEVQERLRRFLDNQADQLRGLVEMGKHQGVLDPDLRTGAVVLAIQSIGIGTHLLLSADRADRHVPTEEEWVAVLERMISGVGPDNDQAQNRDH